MGKDSPLVQQLKRCVDFGARQDSDAGESSKVRLGESNKEQKSRGKYTHPDYQPPSSVSTILRASTFTEGASNFEAPATSSTTPLSMDQTFLLNQRRALSSNRQGQ